MTTTARDVARRIPQAGLVLLPLVLLPEGYHFAHFPKVLFLQLILLLAAGACLVARERGLVSWSLLLFLGWTTLQAWRSLNPWSGGLLLATQVGGIGVALVLARHTRRDDEGDLLRAVALGGGLVAVVGLAECVGFDVLPSAGRPSATMGFRNLAAAVVAGSVPAAVFVATRGRPVQRVLGAAACFALFLFLMYARSRGALLGVISAAVFASAGWLFFVRRRPSARAWLGPAAALVLALLLSGVPPRYTDTSAYRLDEKKANVVQTVRSLFEPGGDRNRLTIWSHTMSMVADHVVIGVGHGNWSAFYPSYDRGDIVHIQSAPRRPHNDFLWILADLGIVGLGLFLWILVVAFRRQEDDEHIAFQCVALVLLVHGLFSFPREQAATTLLLWTAVGVLHRQTRPAFIRNGSAVWVLLFLFAVAGMWLSWRAVRFDGLYARALLAQKQGDRQEQVERGRAAIDLGVFDHRVLLTVADGLPADQAIGVYQTYADLQPHLPVVQNNLGQSLLAEGRYVEAERALRLGIALLPSNGYLRNNLADALRRQGRVEEAKALYDGGFERMAIDYQNLALLYAEMDSLDKAAEMYETAYAMDGTLHEVLYSLAGLYLLQGRVEEAVGAYEQFLSRWDGSPALVRRSHQRLREAYPTLGREMLRKNRVGDGIEAFERQRTLGGARATDHHLLATAYAKLGRRAEALAAAEDAIAADTNFVPVYLTLGQLHESNGDTGVALASYRKFVGLWEIEGRQLSYARERIRALTGP